MTLRWMCCVGPRTFSSMLYIYKNAHFLIKPPGNWTLSDTRSYCGSGTRVGNVTDWVRTQQMTVSGLEYKLHGSVWTVFPGAVLGDFSSLSASRRQREDFRVYRCNSPWENPEGWKYMIQSPFLSGRPQLLQSYSLAPGPRSCFCCSYFFSALLPTRRLPPNRPASAGYQMGRLIPPADKGPTWREVVHRCDNTTKCNKLWQIK